MSNHEAKDARDRARNSERHSPPYSNFTLKLVKKHGMIVSLGIVSSVASYTLCLDTDFLFAALATGIGIYILRNSPSSEKSLRALGSLVLTAGLLRLGFFVIMRGLGSRFMLVEIAFGIIPIWSDPWIW